MGNTHKPHRAILTPQSAWWRRAHTTPSPTKPRPRKLSHTRRDETGAHKQRNLFSPQVHEDTPSRNPPPLPPSSLTTRAAKQHLEARPAHLARTTTQQHAPTTTRRQAIVLPEAAAGLPLALRPCTRPRSRQACLGGAASGGGRAAALQPAAGCGRCEAWRGVALLPRRQPQLALSRGQGGAACGSHAADRCVTRSLLRCPRQAPQLSRGSAWCPGAPTSRQRQAEQRLSPVPPSGPVARRALPVRAGAERGGGLVGTPTDRGQFAVPQQGCGPVWAAAASRRGPRCEMIVAR